MPVDDHTLLLQLERANEALSDRVEDIEEKTPTGEPDYCDCDCANSDITRIEDDLQEAVSILTKLAEQVGEVIERLDAIDSATDTRLSALEERL